MTPRVVEIVTTAHWEGDPRLNRHVDYLTRAGHTGTLTSLRGRGRMTAMWRGLIAIIRSKAHVVIIPDPEMFLPGSLLARLAGKLPVIDIHEDYGKTAMGRRWVPRWARWLVRITANVAVSSGRFASWRVLVAAPELHRTGDFLVLNLPDPESMPLANHDGSRRLVYVGDVTPARGAISMVRVLAELDHSFGLLLIGNVSEETARHILATAQEFGVADRIEMTGRVGHAEAWRRAAGALAGFNLLDPVPAYRQAVATKLWEYMAVGLPPIVSDLPGQAGLIGQIDPGLVCSSPRETAELARDLVSNQARRIDIVSKGRRLLERTWEENRPDLAVQGALEP